MPGYDVTSQELKARLDAGHDLLIVDVREPHEWDVCRIDGAQLIPLQTLPARLGELPRDQDIVVHCKSGVRSAKAVEFMRAQGFGRVQNLTGGIFAWIDTVDPAQPKY